MMQTFKKISTTYLNKMLLLYLNLKHSQKSNS
jgi:hypothetical protein